MGGHRAIGLDDMTLVCQDWGGLIGLRLVGEHPARFARVVAANTMLPTGDTHPADAFLAWQRFSQETPDFPVGGIVKGGCATDLAPEVIAAYDAPFPDDTYKAGARQFPLLVPTSPDDPAAAANRAAWDGLRLTNARSCAPSPTPTRSPGEGTARCAPTSQGPPANPTRPSPAPATSSRRTKASNLPPSSPTSSGPGDDGSVHRTILSVRTDRRLDRRT